MRLLQEGTLPPLQKIVVKENLLLSQKEEGKVTHKFSSNFSEQIKGQEKKYFGQRTVENLPTLPDGPGVFCWYQRFWPITSLNELLRLAKSRSTQGYISQSDLRIVLEYCNYRGDVKYVNPDEAAHVSFKILAHLAENGWRLPPVAIKVIIKEVRKCREHTINYALLALAHLVNNGQSNNQIPKLLNLGIKKLKKLAKKEYLETVIVALAAKSNLSLVLTASEKDLLKIALVKANTYPANRFDNYAHSTLKLFEKKSEISDWDWYSHVTVLSTLEFIQNHAKAGKMLTQQEWQYLVQHWNQSIDIPIRIFIVNILRFAIINGQRCFPNQNQAITMLSMALSEGDIEQRQAAIVASTYLIVHSELAQSPQLFRNLCSSLQTAQELQQNFALRSFCNVLNFQGITSFSFTNEWIIFFNQLSTEERLSTKSQNTARYLSRRLEGKIDKIESYILHPDHCIKTTETIAIAAENGDTFADSLLEKLLELIKSDFPEAAKINALIAFQFIAKNKQIIPKLILKYLIKNYLYSDHVALRNMLLLIIGNCASQHLRYLKRRVAKELLNLLIHPELVDNVVYVYSTLVEEIRKWRDFCEISGKLLQFLSSTACTNRQGQLIILLLGKALEKHVVYPLPVIQNLMSSRLFFKDDLNTRLRILQIVGCSIQLYQELDACDELYQKILSFCDSDNEQERTDAIYVLESTIRRASEKPSKAIMHQIESFIIRNGSIVSSYPLLKALTEKECQFSKKILKFLLFNPVDQTIEDNLRALRVIVEIAKGQTISFSVLEQLIDLINDESEREQTDCAIQILENQLKNRSSTAGKLFQSAVAQIRLLKTVSTYGFSLNTKRNALTILRVLSENDSVYFSVEFLSELEPLIRSNEIKFQEAALRLIKNKIPNMGSYIFNQNPIIPELTKMVLTLFHQESHQLLILLILAQFTEAGVVLSNLISVKEFTAISHILLVEDHEVNRRLAAYLFVKYAAHHSEESKILYEIEYAGQLLTQNKSTEHCMGALRSLISKAKLQKPMTIGVFKGLAHVIKAQPSVLVQELVSLLECLQEQGRTLPTYLLLAISTAMKIRPEFAKITARAILKNQSQTIETYHSLEGILLNAKVSDETLIDVIGALAIAAKREFVFQPATIEQLFILASTEKNQLSLAAIQGLLTLFKAEKIQGNSGKFWPKKLIHSLEFCKNPELIKATHELMYHLSLQFGFDRDTLLLIREHIKMTDHKQQLLDILQTQAKRKTLPRKCQHILQYKLCEEQFLVEKDLKEIPPDLLANPSLMSAQTWVTLAELLDAPISPYVLNTLLIKLHHVSMNIPILLLEKIIPFIADPVSSTLIKNLLDTVIKNHYPFSEKALTLFNSLMVNSECQNRITMLEEVLYTIHRYQPLPYAMILQLKFQKFKIGDQHSFQDIQSYLRRGCILTANHVLNLKNCIEQSTFTHEVLALLSSLNASFPKGGVQTLLIPLINEAFQNKNAKAMSLVVYFIKHQGVDADSLTMAARQIVRHMTTACDNKQNIDVILAELCALKFATSEQEKIHLKLLDYFFITGDHRAQLTISSALLFYLYSDESTPSHDFLQQLRAYKDVVAKEVGFMDLVDGFFTKFVWLGLKKADIFYPLEIKANAALIVSYLIDHVPDCAETLATESFIDALKLESRQAGMEEAFLNLVPNFSLKRQLRILLTALSLPTTIYAASQLALHLNKLEETVLVSQLMALSEKTYHDSQKRFLDACLHQSHKYSNMRKFLRVLILQRQWKMLRDDEVDEALSIYLDLEKMQLKLNETNPQVLRELWIKHSLLLLSPRTQIEHDHVVAVDNFFIQRHWDIATIQWFFNHLKQNHTNPLALEHFLAFCDDYELKTAYILSLNYERYSLEELEREILYSHINAEIKELSGHAELANLIWIQVKALCDKGWDPHQFLQFFIHFKRKEKSPDPKDLYDWLAIVCRYRDFFSEKEFYELYLQNDADEQFAKRLHQTILEGHFSADVKEHSLAELLQLLSDNTFDSSKPYVEELMKNTDVKYFFSLVEKSYLSQGSVMVTQSPISVWTEKDVSNWAKAFKNHCGKMSLTYEIVLLDPQLLAEIFAVLKRACVLQFDYEPRLVQLLSVFLLSSGKHPKRGLLAEVATGEGKSLMIVMLTVIKSLFGKKVDIITSSPLLAKRDAEDFSKFYSLFSLKTASNLDDDYQTGLKDCYKPEVDIVYGDISSFQFDLLRQEYSGLKTRGNRGFDEVIIDEVDNLLIDEGSKIAMLSSVLPSIDELRPMLSQIWLQLKILHNISQNPGQNFDQIQNPFFQISQMDVSVDEKKQLIRKKIRSDLEKYIDEVLLNKNSNFKYPKHLYPFINHQKKKWVDSAMLAFYDYKMKKHYKIQSDTHGIETIVPVDFLNTGVIQMGTMWGDGLHQFLQIKHGLKVTPENITTNFLSNIAYIRRYQANITGISGTLGSAKAQELLNDIYGAKGSGLDFLKIPSFLPNRLTKLPLELAQNEDEWLNRVTDSAVSEARQGRVCLIVCESIDEAEKIRMTLQEHNKFSGTLHYYTDNIEENDSFFAKVQLPNTIIIATNLAGRGTDVKLSNEVIRHGGLHLCGTFLPVNLRVEQQIFGRTARRGEPGTAQLIINMDALKECLPSASKDALEKLKTDPASINVLRDKEEKNRLHLIRCQELAMIELKDELFEGFLKLLKELDAIHDDEQQGPLWSALDFSKKQFDSEHHRYKRMAAEEAWGFWLKEVDFTKPTAEINVDFARLQKTIKDEYQQNTIIKNPIYYTKMGHALLANVNSMAYKIFHAQFCQMALVAYNKAIKLDKSYSFNAAYHKAYALIKLAKHDYKKKVKKLHEKILVKLESLILQENSVLQVLIHDSRYSLEYLSQEHYTQIQNCVQVYELFASSIRQSLAQINQSLKLIDLRLHKINLESFHKNLLPKDVISHLQNHNGELELSFNHLKTHSDVWEHSQLRNTVAKIPIHGRIDLVFDGRKLVRPNGQVNALKKLLPINRYEERSVRQETEAAQVSEPVSGLRDNLYYYGAKTYKATTDTLGGISDRLKTMAKPVEGLGHYLQDYYYNSKIVDTLPLTLEFKVANLDDARCLLMHCESYSQTSFELSISLPHLELLYFLQSRWYQFPVLVRDLSEDKHHGQLYQDVPISHINLTTLYMNPFSEVRFLVNDLTNLSSLLSDLTHAQFVLKKCSSESLLMLKLRGLQQTEAQSLFEKTNCDLKLSYEGLTTEQATSLLYLTSEQHDAVVMTVSQLNPLEAVKLVSEADRAEQDVTPHHKAICDELTTINNDKNFCNDFATNGYLYLYELEEKKPFPWKGFTLLLAMSAAQIGGGMAITYLSFGIGVNIGSSIFAEGISDLIRACTTAYTREFSFSAYLTQKSITYSLSMITVGMCHAYAAAQGVTQAEKIVEAALQLSDKTVSGAVVITQVSKELGKESLKEVIKRGAITLAEKASIEAATKVINGSASYVTNQSQSRVMDTMTRESQILFGNPRWQQILTKLFVLDKFLGHEPTLLSSVETRAGQLIKVLDFSLPNTQFADEAGLSKFQTEFHEYLCSLDHQFSNFTEILQRKFPQIGREKIERMHHLLEKNHIVSHRGVQLECLIKDFSTMGSTLTDKIKFNRAHYDINNYRLETMPWDAELIEYRPHIIAACLHYRACVGDDYSYQYKKFTKETANWFTEHVMKALGLVANLTSSALNAGASIAITQISGVLNAHDPKRLGKEAETLAKSSVNDPTPKDTVDGRLNDAIRARSDIPNDRWHGRHAPIDGRGIVPPVKPNVPGSYDRPPLYNRNNFFPKPIHTPVAAISMIPRAAGLIIDSATSIVNLSLTEIDLWIIEAENKNILHIYQNKMDKLIKELENIELEEGRSVSNTIDINKEKQKNKIFQELEDIENKLNTEIELMKENFAKIDEYTYSHASQIIKNNTQQAESLFKQPNAFFPNLAFSDLSQFEQDPLDLSSPLKKKKEHVISQLMSRVGSTGLNHMVDKYGEIQQTKLELKKQLAEIKIATDYQILFQEHKTRQAYRKALIEKARCDLNATEIQHQILKFYKFYQQNSTIESELIRSALEQKKIELLIINRCGEDLSKLRDPGLSETRTIIH